ncbi:MAG: c-type cytochrome [Acidiphilium sp.]|nr:c-type cytochrome [Acidiphilium sp.]MDD4934626.1 c-type cytochrome [Acidiphilium sp.]
MRRPIVQNCGAIAVLTFAAIVTAAAAPPPQIASCASCHGAGGLGNASAGFPALAGLPASYTAQQLYAFKHGTRVNAIMTQMAAPLNAAQRNAIAAYYAALPVPVTPEPAPLPTGAGAALAINGDWGHRLTGVPSCDSCHGPEGVGVGAVFPRLAGQPKAYLAAQLVDWQKGSRNDDPLHLMRNVAARLSARQIDAVAAYYAALSANPADLPKPGDAKGGQ